LKVKNKINGIIFDMDGTLTIPSIDFAELREVLNISPEQDLLGVTSSYSEEQKRRHLGIIERYEQEALKNSRLQPDVNSVLNAFAAANIKMGVITRNSVDSAKKVLSLISIEFEPILTRDFIPVKPDPAPINYILEYWDLLPENVLMVGDYRDDLLCGKNAGTSTCFFSNPEKASFAELADFTVFSFAELKQMIL
jgi:HAD superfamily hydrolase (TIGR01549 family)